MTRIATPATIDAAPAAAQPLLEVVGKQLGSVPNLFRVVANSPAALEGYLGLSGALGKGTLPAATRERIALAVAEINGCSYCLAAHSLSGQEPRQAGRGRDPCQPQRPLDRPQGRCRRAIRSGHHRGARPCQRS